MPRFSRSFLILTIPAIAALLLTCFHVERLARNDYVIKRTARQGKPRPLPCIANLRVIDGAKEQWALEHKIAELSPIDPGPVAAYLRDRTMPQCPKGGSYSYNVVGIPPQCSHPGHFMEGPDSCASNLQIINDALRLWVSKSPSMNDSNLLGADVPRFFKQVGLRPDCPFNGKYFFDPELGTMRCKGAHVGQLK